MTLTNQIQQSTTSTGETLLEIQNLQKAFGGVKALNGVSFGIHSGEIHALLGENGAGKSTLMNILAGVYRSDDGTILLNGEPYAPANPAEAREKGISIVFQELALFPLLPVDANLYAGRELHNGIELDHRQMKAQAVQLFKRMGIELRPDETLSALSIGKRQWVEIARALTGDARILILDEPNSALNQHETQALFSLIRTLKAQGMTIIYISHRLEEVFAIADRMTVLRDGNYVGTWKTEETDTSQIVAAMVGRSVEEQFRHNQYVHEEIVLDIQNYSIEGMLKPVTFSVRKGEVVGLTGLAGAGMTDLLEGLFGLRSGTAGEIQLDGHAVQLTSPREAMKQSMAMVPADRRGAGLMPNWSVLDNITVSIMDQLSQWGIIRHRRAQSVGQEYVKRLNIVTDSLHKGVLLLSGGNQQKTLLARWLATEPRLLILDDPTRGIDVGAKHEIYQLIDAAAKRGVAILFTSSEIEEVLGLSDRILVMRNAQIIAEVPSHIADKELLTELAAGDRERGLSMLSNRLGRTVNSMDTLRHDASNAAKTVEPTPAAGSTGQLLGKIFAVREMGVLLALLAVMIVFSFLTPYFLTISNLLLITRQMAMLGVIAMGMTFVLASGEVDLSVGWIFNMVMGVMAAVITAGINPWLAIPVGLLVGTLLGMANGLMAVFLNLPTIIVTLATLTLYRGLALAVNGGRTIGNLPDSSFFLIGSGGMGPIPNMSIIMIVVFAVGAWVLRQTRFARHLLIMGGNRPAAERVGIPIRRLRVAVMGLSGLTSGIAGVLGLAFLGAADPQSGTGYELIAIASAIIGGAQLGGGSGTVWGTLIGIALIMSIQNGLVLMGLRPAWQITSTGLIIIAAVTVDYLTRARRERAVKQLSK